MGEPTLHSLVDGCLLRCESTVLWYSPVHLSNINFPVSPTKFFSSRDVSSRPGGDTIFAGKSDEWATDCGGSLDRKSTESEGEEQRKDLKLEEPRLPHSRVWRWRDEEAVLSELETERGGIRAKRI